MDVVSILLGWFACIVRWFEQAMEVDTIQYREYNMVGGAEVIKLHQLIFEFGAIA